MRFTESDIKADLLDSWDSLEESQYPEDLLSEFADSAVPIYNNEIIEDWQEMPSDYDDSWKEYTDSNENGIINLMRIDLFAYYLDTYNRIYREIRHDKDTE